MKRRLLLVSGIIAILLIILVGGLPVVAKGFVHGIAINYDGNTYYFQGEPVGDGWDIPGHEWVQAGPDHLRGKHYNTGPGGASQWWSADAPDGGFLYNVDAIIDSVALSPEEAATYKARGYVHRHELVDGNGVLIPGIGVYLKHTARTTFTLTHGNVHWVTLGIDYNFIPNW